VTQDGNKTTGDAGRAHLCHGLSQGGGVCPRRCSLPCSHSPSVILMWPTGWPNREGLCQPLLQGQPLHICIAYKETVPPFSAETALQVLKLPASHPQPYMMVLTNYGINMPGEGRQLSQRIGNVIKQGMIFFHQKRSIHLSGQCCRKESFGGFGSGGEGHCRQKLKG